jgi:hypothetical protein
MTQPTPRLQQVPLFVDPALERAVAALPAALRDVARGLRLHLLADGRTFLEVAAAGALADSVTLAELLGGDRHRAPAAARRRAWYDCYTGMASKSYPVVARAFGGTHHTTVLAGVRLHARRLAGELAAAEAVRDYIARQPAPANGPAAADLARTG